MITLMRNLLILSIFLMFTGIVGAATAGAETAAMSEEELTEFIKKVIRENPRLIYDTVNQYVTEMKKKQAEKKLSDQEIDILLSHRVEDKIHPHNPILGPESAPVTIIEYTDFQCPYCIKGDEMVRMLMDRYPGKIKFVFKNYPTAGHSHALMAAKAAMAAHKQGHFWDFHDLLFQAAPEIDENTIQTCAGLLMLDVAMFHKDRESDEIEKWINLDKADGDKMDFAKTPGFVINGVPIAGVLNEVNFTAVIERLIDENKQSSGK